MGLLPLIAYECGLESHCANWLMARFRARSRLRMEVEIGRSEVPEPASRSAAPCRVLGRLGTNNLTQTGLGFSRDDAERGFLPVLIPRAGRAHPVGARSQKSAEGVGELVKTGCNLTICEAIANSSFSGVSLACQGSALRPSNGRVVTATKLISRLVWPDVSTRRIAFAWRFPQVGRFGHLSLSPFSCLLHASTRWRVKAKMLKTSPATNQSQGSRPVLQAREKHRRRRAQTRPRRH